MENEIKTWLAEIVQAIEELAKMHMGILLMNKFTNMVTFSYICKNNSTDADNCETNTSRILG